MYWCSFGALSDSIFVITICMQRQRLFFLRWPTGRMTAENFCFVTVCSGSINCSCCRLLAAGIHCYGQQQSCAYAALFLSKNKNNNNNSKLSIRRWLEKLVFPLRARVFFKNFSRFSRRNKQQVTQLPKLVTRAVSLSLSLSLLLLFVFNLKRNLVWVFGSIGAARQQHINTINNWLFKCKSCSRLFLHLPPPTSFPFCFLSALLAKLQVAQSEA